MAPRYRVRIRDQAGILVEELTDFRAIDLQHKVNEPGTFSVVFGGRDTWLDYLLGILELDGQIDIDRCDQAVGLDWYTEFAGFHRRPRDGTDPSGDRIVETHGLGYMSLIDRRGILYPEGTAEADKSDFGESVIKAYVLENAGALATLANGRFVDGVTPGLDMAIDLATGLAWQGSRSGRNLGDVVREICIATGLRADIVGEGPALFEFRTYPGQRGLDRSQQGMDPVTGLNAAGNVPVIFSLEGGTASDMAYELDRMAETTTAVVIGRGVGTNQTVAVRQSAARLDSPWNSWEAIYNGANQREVADLESIGDHALQEAAYRESFQFSPMQLESLVYGLHYYWGDLVTGSYHGIVRHKEIVAVTIRVSQGGEALTHEMEDVPR